MLCDLRIRNLLLIEDLELNLTRGFNAMTGETGAGKSVVIGALKLLLGGRAGPEHVRPGAEQAEVEALFDLTDSPATAQKLEASGLRPSDELVVRRVIPASGRSRAYLNGRLCALSELAALAPELVDIASQHESVTLADPATHLGYLDAFGHLEGARASVAEQVTVLQEVSRKRSELQELAAARAERDQFLRFQLNSIQEVGVRAGEMEELRAERSRLRSSARLTTIARGASERLSEGERPITDEIRSIQAEVNAACELDSSLEDVRGLVETAAAHLDEAGRSLARYAESLHDDPDRLDQIEERLFRIERLLRLHGPTEAQVLEAQERLARQLDELESVDDRLMELQRDFDARLARASEDALRLSTERKGVASKLGAAVGRELQALGMGGAKVLVEVASVDGSRGELSVQGARLTADGIDRVEFLIGPNKGIEPRPLRKIASGGELSRALLAIKRVLAASGPAGLYVFDEVDTGVGGAIAEQLGQALADISRHRQVLCITHLAPIAALGDSHFVVEKTQQTDVATTTVRRLEGKARLREVARMLSGARITEASMRTAAEMVGVRDTPSAP